MSYTNGAKRFPLAQHIVSMERTIAPPQYLVEQPIRDLRRVFPEDGSEELKVNILERGPNYLAVWMSHR